jgi:threonine dehydrogenase-like Zn-dependent dehydrogenase
MQRQSLPAVGPGQILVRLQGCGICGSNVPVWEGRPWFEYPLAAGAPGHEAWGIIEAAAGDVGDFDIGERVAILSYHGFAEFDVADASAAVRLPMELEERPFPGEPLACAMNVFRRCGIQADQNVAIVGVGFLGALLTQLAVDAGARVIAVSRRNDALLVARQFGASDCLSIAEGSTLQRIRELTGGAGCECVIEATGHQEPLDLAGEAVAVRGRLVIAGYHQDGSRQINLQSWNWRGIDVINAHERDPRVYVEGMRSAVEAVSSGRLKPWSLITHRYHLNELDQALEATRTRPSGFMKAIVHME